MSASFNEGFSARNKRICFSIAGESNNHFVSQIAMFNLALRQLPEPYSQAHIKAFLGVEDEHNYDQKWGDHLTNVEIISIKKRNYSSVYIPQALQRFCANYSDYDYVIMCDADTLILGDLDEVLSSLSKQEPIAGVLAHLPPSNFSNPNNNWREISHKLCKKSINLRYKYTLIDYEEGQNTKSLRAPYYLNNGFIAFHAQSFSDFSAVYPNMRELVCELINPPFFAGQIALALTINHLNWEGICLPMRYNFPNDSRAIKQHGSEANDVIVLHYLRENNYSRSTLFSQENTFYQFLELNHTVPDRLVFDAIMKLTKGHYPFN